MVFSYIVSTNTNSLKANKNLTNKAEYSWALKTFKDVLLKNNWNVCELDLKLQRRGKSPSRRRQCPGGEEEEAPSSCRLSFYAAD
jgi:hypothetical protein